MKAPGLHGPRIGFFNNLTAKIMVSVNAKPLRGINTRQIIGMPAKRDYNLLINE